MSLRLVPLALLLGTPSALAFDTSKLLSGAVSFSMILRRSSPNRPDCSKKSTKCSPRPIRKKKA